LHPPKNNTAVTLPGQSHKLNGSYPRNATQGDTQELFLSDIPNINLGYLGLKFRILKYFEDKINISPASSCRENHDKLQAGLLALPGFLPTFPSFFKKRSSEVEKIRRQVFINESPISFSVFFNLPNFPTSYLPNFS
jgi:hypothetical protein